nr:hypothetical protein [Gammaproteobacteria bacterium]
ERRLCQWLVGREQLLRLYGVYPWGRLRSSSRQALLDHLARWFVFALEVDLVDRDQVDHPALLCETWLYTTSV